jgi:antitoxin (DNA-binding transcriptional repressor) of toxin-antitoxin stability system
MKQITSTELRSVAGAVVDSALAGEITQVIRNGRVVAYVVGVREFEQIAARYENELGAKVIHICNSTGLSVPEVLPYVHQLIKDWGRDRVVIRESDAFGGALLHRDATEEIVRRIEQGQKPIEDVPGV